MLNISLLPEDILLLVFKYVHGPIPKLLRSWSNQLRVIAVCRQWRIISLRMVYSSVYIECDETHRIIFDKNGHIIGKRPIPAWKSNIELALENKCHQFIRCIDIRQYCSFNQLTFMCQLLKILQIGIIDWKGINKLSIRLYGNDDNGISNLDGDNEQEAMYMAQALAQEIPNVCKYKPTCSRLYGQENIFLAKLTECYSKQLVVFRGEFVFPKSIQAPSNQLTYLRLEHINDIDVEYNCVCSLSLQHLILKDVPYTFMWNYFYDESDQKKLVFRDLKTLSIIYECGSVAHKVPLNYQMIAQPRELVFPKLQHLEVKNILRNCPIMFHAQLPPALYSLNLSCAIENSNIFSTVKLPQTKSATLSLYGWDSEDNAVYIQSVNCLLQSIDAKLHFGLEYSVSIIRDLSNLKWDMLTRLRVVNVPDISCFLVLLANIPNVKELCISTIVCPVQAVSNTSSQGDALNTQLQLPNLKLAYLEITDFSNHAVRSFVPFLRLLFMLVPSLYTAKINKGETTRALISKYSDIRLGFLFKSK